MKSFIKLEYMYAHDMQVADSTQRFGQWFVNQYVENSWPDLFYMTDYEFASIMIKDYLERYNYEDKLPQPIDRS